MNRRSVGGSGPKKLVLKNFKGWSCQRVLDFVFILSMLLPNGRPHSTKLLVHKADTVHFLRCRCLLLRPSDHAAPCIGHVDLLRQLSPLFISLSLVEGADSFLTASYTSGSASEIYVSPSLSPSISRSLCLLMLGDARFGMHRMHFME